MTVAAAGFDAQVIAAFGRHLRVRDRQGRLLEARPFGRRLSVVCGDQVRCELDTRHAEAHVVGVHPRRTCLYRSNARGEAEPVFANLTLLLVALAPLPAPDLFVVDRYVAAATCAAVRVMLVLNKCELGITPELRAELDAFAAAGYPILECSARAGLGIAALREGCAGALAALVGQSGVGKSSLVRCLVPDVHIETGELVREEEGRHTTTASHLYELEGGGQLIDAPGVRDFAPALTHLEERTLGFREVAALAPGCRFADCRHVREPDCAVRAAAQSGALHPRRLESYRRLRRLREELAPRTPGRRG
jgi:ribosome biogenesis GTPase